MQDEPNSDLQRAEAEIRKAVEDREKGRPDPQKTFRKAIDEIRGDS
jgi:hypothetical protein